MLFHKIVFFLESAFSEVRAYSGLIIFTKTIQEGQTEQWLAGKTHSIQWSGKWGKFRSVHLVLDESALLGGTV